MIGISGSAMHLYVFVVNLWCALTPVAPLATTPDWGIVPDVLFGFCLGAVFH